MYINSIFFFFNILLFDLLRESGPSTVDFALRDQGTKPMNLQFYLKKKLIEN